MFERHVDPASQLLNAWSTDYVTLRQLIDCLQSAGLLREASFIRGLVQLPDSLSLAAEPPSTATHDAHDSLDVAYTDLSRWTNNFSDMPVHSGGCLLGRGGYADVFKGLQGRV